MADIVVVGEVSDWPVPAAGYEVVPARAYLTDRRFAEHPRMRVINACRSFRYQKVGYYVSLLATARGHKPLPALATVQEVRTLEVARLLAQDIDDALQATAATIDPARTTFEVDSYFGRDPTERFSKLADELFERFPAPLLRAVFKKGKDGRWQLHAVSFLSPDEIPPEHHATLGAAAAAHFAHHARPSRPRPAPYDLAILADADDATPPSNPEALQRMVRAAESVGFAAEIIDRRDYARLPQFDALFIRETTAVNHRTYRFAQRAAAEGLVVIDDPESILRCTNKVFLAEMLARYEVPAPPTAIVHRSNVAEVAERIGFPLILKQPDSSFSLGVVKVDDRSAYEQAIAQMLRRSELVVAQAFTPTDFDWRVGVLARQPLFAAKYYMARGHWKVVVEAGTPQEATGISEAVTLHQVPPAVMEVAVRAANLMGDGLYGVDLKEIDGKPYVVEVNDNPSLDAGSEDALLGPELYVAIAREFRRRIEQKRSKVPK